MSSNLLPRLASQIGQARTILFTGAGFSMDAYSRSDAPIPSSKALLDELWKVAFPGEPYDGSGLQDTFEAAVQQAERATLTLLQNRLTVDPESLPQHYEVWFSMPWYRVYTLNIDDLAEAAARAFELPREIKAISAISDAFVPANGALQVVHLNGRLSDLPQTTFSGRQYAQRIARSDAWYANVARELTHHPFVFVGTTLDEPPLWQYVEERGRKPDRRERELRPGSCLVTPALPRAKAVALGGYNVDHVDMEAGPFATEVLAKLADAAAKGMRELVRSRQDGKVTLENIEAIRNDDQNDAREFLLGREPRWTDITDGFAVERVFDDQLAELTQRNTRLLSITGTAGSGKSTSAMRLCLSFSAAGRSVFRVSPDASLHARRLRDVVKAADPGVLLIDDADKFGEGLPALVLDLRLDVPDCLIICALRSSRYEGVGLAVLVETRPEWAAEAVAPALADRDIDDLLDALTRANRLGALKSKTASQQRSLLVEKCGRQLLVALIEATSGKRFDQKIESECQALAGDAQLLYAVATLATNFNIALRDPELLLAVGGDPAVAVRALDSLVRTHLLVRDSKDRLRLRHRLIAERAVEYFRSQRLVEVPLRGLVASLATTSHGRPLRDTPQGRATIRLLNHRILIEFIRKSQGADGSVADLAAIRGVYEEVESLLTDDYHYWLQRSALETEVGDLDLATNFVEQARALNGTDPYVRTQWAYATLKRASRNPDDPASRDNAKAAFDELDEAIAQRGRRDSYPFHIYGSQGLAWTNRAPFSTDERVEVLQTLRRVVEEGIRYHPARRDLKTLALDLEAAYLNLAIN